MQLPKPPLVLAQGHNTGYLNKEQRMEDQEVRAKWTNETDMTVRKWNRHDCEEPGVYPWGIGTRLPSSESERAPRELNILMGINTKRDTMEIITWVIIKGENLKPSPIRELGLCDTGGAIPTEIKTGEKPCVCQITNMPTVASPAYIPILSSREMPHCNPNISKLQSRCIMNSTSGGDRSELYLASIMWPKILFP